MSIPVGTWNEKDERGIRTSTEVPVFLGRETLRRAGQVAKAKGFTMAGYVAIVVRMAVNLDFEDLIRRERD